MSRKLVAFVRDECRDSSLTTTARGLALLLASYSLADGQCTVSQAELADVLGCTRHTIRRCTSELEAAGLVTVERSTLAESRYRFPVQGVIHNAARVQHGGAAPVQQARAASRAASRAAPVQRGKEGNEGKECDALDADAISLTDAIARGLVPPSTRRYLA